MSDLAAIIRARTSVYPIICVMQRLTPESGRAYAVYVDI
jgi:hypothetical protein